ncbi:MAG: hypothetical protein P8047_07180 [Gammaproteobacteria bacterium]
MVSLQSGLRSLLLLCLVVLSQIATAAVLEIKAERHQLELGQPIWLTLRSDQTAVSLDTLDFDRWRHQVALPRVYDANLSRDGSAQVLRLRVYPLHAGTLILPGLSFLQYKTPVLRFTILPARDPVTHAPMAFACKVSTRQPWQQQQVIVACHLNLHDHYALFAQPHRQQQDIVLLPMQVHKQRITQAKIALTRYQLGWVVVPSRSGKQSLQLPPIEYVRDGVVVRRFYLPPLELKIRALPAWLPGTIPIGQLKLRAYGLSQSWLNSSVLSRLQLKLQLSGVAPALVPDYAGQLHSDRQFAFYQAQRHSLMRVNATGLQHELDYSVPVRAKHIGIYRLPDLRLQYFDPASGTLESKILRGPRIVIINGWLQLLFAVLVLWLGFVLGRRGLIFASRYWQRFHAYQQALQQLRQTDSLAGIRRAMQTMARAEGWNENLSYLQWQARMQAKTMRVEVLPVDELNAAAYGHAAIDTVQVVRDLMDICRQRRLAFS